MTLRDELARLLDACPAAAQLPTTPTYVPRHSVACHASNSPQVCVVVFVHADVLFSDLHDHIVRIFDWWFKILKFVKIHAFFIFLFIKFIFTTFPALTI